MPKDNSSNSKPQPTVSGFFSGVGGIELGFARAGFKLLYSNEIDPKAGITLRANFADGTHRIDIRDLREVQADEVPDASVIVGGFPCQAFSVAGYRKGFEDERGEVFFQLARIIHGKQARAIFLENVKNLKTHDGGNTFRVICETLQGYGYQLTTMVLNASEYANIPQNRERVYIVGFLNPADHKHFTPPEPVKLSRRVTDLVDFHRQVDARYYYAAENCGFYDTLQLAMTKANTLYQWRRVYVRENKSNVCPTLTANMGTGGHNVPLILTPHGIRKLTPRECFAFQGYPEDFVLPRELAITHLYKQAGNSVVVPVIERIAKAIRAAFEQTDSRD
ncbi:MAG: DNA cytosine methyltransferase [Bacteroidia bacterium]|nr:MAG: DNA cytosine methyltransferase [Bacteroidia bacterium]